MFRTISLFFLWMCLALPTVAQTLIETRNRDIDLFAGQGKLLKLEQPAQTVFLANPDVADVEIKSPTLLYIYGKRIGETTLFVIDDNEEVTLSSAVDVSINIDAVSGAAHAAVSNGQFSVSEVGGAIIVSGRVGTIADSERIDSVVRQLAGETVTVVNSLALETPAQINLQVRIAEVSRSVSEDLGVNWTSLSGSRSNSGEGLLTTFSISGTIEALKSRGLVTILSEPNLTARSGDKASFLAGGRFPYQTIAEGDDSSSVQFEPYGVELEFLPEVLRSDQIKLNVQTQIRELDFSNGSTSNTQNIPMILERSASTTIEVGSGQSFAIAGLFSATTQQDVQDVPGLGDIPILGALFRSTSYQSGETELVIIVTPYIVEPAAPDKFKTPLEGFAPANTLDRHFLGSLSTGVPISKSGPVSVKNINGNAGFLLQ
ncbi:type II and III secretion system protein family protein [Pacificibacter marinus]|uniref:type II and III secretion system protein family protein n=1 Tax=Pacificibacter marinus TaxID=658057 RepID=UPI001C06AAAD|nr:type II and III secretion system protein family protein [Pacificibacter marinus]MBU2865849.1 type II and III secretion system protein family protein [Pacificibacter marinus]